MPVTYLKAWAAEDGMLRVFRKEEPTTPYCSKPLRTGFEDYYYAFENNDGEIDTDSLEAIFSSAETRWPELLGNIRHRRDMQEHLNDFLELVALQRGRVPAARDMYELMQSDNIVSTAKFMHQRGMLPPLPSGAEDILDRLEVSVDPQSSLRAISLVLSGCERVFNLLNYGVVFNHTETMFLTSDNPVMWFDPSLVEEDIEPYNLRPGGPIELLFPLAPNIALFGWTPRKEEGLVHGIRYGSVSGLHAVDRVNRMVARFAYDVVFASDLSQSDVIEKFSSESPVLQTVTMPSISGQYIVGRMIFGQRRRKGPVGWVERSDTHRSFCPKRQSLKSAHLFPESHGDVGRNA